MRLRIGIGMARMSTLCHKRSSHASYMIYVNALMKIKGMVEAGGGGLFQGIENRQLIENVKRSILPPRHNRGFSVHWLYMEATSKFANAVEMTAEGHASSPHISLSLLPDTSQTFYEPFPLLHGTLGAPIRLPWSFFPE